jgi:hypothetical protein
MFLWTVVAIMAIALAVEVFSLIALSVAVSGTARRARLIKQQFAEKVRPTNRLAQEVRPALRLEIEKIRVEGKEVGTILGAQFRAMQSLWQDASRRKHRLRLRFGRGGGASIEQWQRDKKVVQRGVLTPIRKAATVVLGVRATTWLLRRVA